MVLIEVISIKELSYTYPDQTIARTNLSCLFKSNKIALLGAKTEEAYMLVMKMCVTEEMSL